MQRQVKIEQMNATKDHFLHAPIREPFPDGVTFGSLFRGLQKTYGRCIGHIYQRRGNTEMVVGWCFQRRERYDDCNETYLCETWVTVVDYQPAVDWPVSIAAK